MSVVRAGLNVVFLTLIYCLTLASFAPLDVAIGATLSGFFLLLFRQYLERTQLATGSTTPWQRLLGLPAFVAAIAWDILRGTFQVASYSLGFRSIERAGVIEVPIGERSAQGVAVSGIALTLAPGSVLVEVDKARGVMLVHCIDATDPVRICEDLQRFYDRYQRRVFP